MLCGDVLFWDSAEGKLRHEKTVTPQEQPANLQRCWATQYNTPIGRSCPPAFCVLQSDMAESTDLTSQGEQLCVYMQTPSHTYTHTYSLHRYTISETHTIPKITATCIHKTPIHTRHTHIHIYSDTQHTYIHIFICTQTYTTDTQTHTHPHTQAEASPFWKTFLGKSSSVYGEEAITE